MKTITVNDNPFKVGMVFKNSREVADFLNLKDKKHTNIALNNLSHYCEYHRDDDYSITIEKVFDKVKPFKVQGFKYEIGQVITVTTGSYIIIDRYIGQDPHRENGKCSMYKCKCLKDDYVFDLQEYRISFGIGCPLCGNRKRIDGIRSLWDTEPQVLRYLVNPEKAKLLTPHSDKRVLCKCPECGSQKEVIVSNLVKHGFSCSHCSDNISYPNKFIRHILKQLNISFIPEKSFSWSNRKIYDEYLPDFNMIIENHGLQHYEYCSHFLVTLHKQQQIDKEKKQMAVQNGIQYYVELDCRESKLDWIKKSVMNSILPKIFSFKEEDIDWEECDTFASTNRVIKDICESWTGNNNISDISKEYKMNPHTISNYLEIGSKCGYCDFAKHDNTKNGRKYVFQAKSKPIYCITDDVYFFSKYQCEEYYKSIGDSKFKGYSLYVYINKQKPYHNKMFKYVTKKEYNAKKNESINNKNIKVIGDLYLEKYVLKEEQENEQI